MKRNWIILLTVLAAATVFIVSNEMRQGKQPQPPSDSMIASALPDAAPKKGSPAPAFELQALDDTATYRVGGPRDKLLLVNFWASWCWPCEKEAPDLVKAYDRYGDQMDLYAVNATDNDKVRNARVFVEEQGFTKFPVLTDSKGEAGKAYMVFNYPTSFLIDRNGYIVERIEGMMTLEQMEQMIESHLG